MADTTNTQVDWSTLKNNIDHVANLKFPDKYTIDVNQWMQKPSPTAATNVSPSGEIGSISTNALTDNNITDRKSLISYLQNNKNSDLYKGLAAQYQGTDADPNAWDWDKIESDYRIGGHYGNRDRNRFMNAFNSGVNAYNRGRASNQAAQTALDQNNAINSVKSAFYYNKDGKEQYKYFDKDNNPVDLSNAGDLSNFINISEAQTKAKNDSLSFDLQKDAGNALTNIYNSWAGENNLSNAQHGVILGNNQSDIVDTNNPKSPINMYSKNGIKSIQAKLGLTGKNVDGKYGNQTRTYINKFLQDANNSEADKQAIYNWAKGYEDFLNQNDSNFKAYDNRKFGKNTYNSRVGINEYTPNYNNYQPQTTSNTEAATHKQGGSLKMKVNYFQPGGVVAAQTASAKPDVSSQLAKLILTATQDEKALTQVVQLLQSGEPQVQEAIKTMTAKAQQGDEEAAQATQVLQAIMKKMQGQAQAAKRGAKLSYLHSLKTGCPDGYEVSYNKKGGHLCKECLKKHAQEDSNASEQTPKDACGSKLKKKLISGKKLAEGNKITPTKQASKNFFGGKLYLNY